MDLESAYQYRLEWIVSFVAVADHRGFSAAAKALYRSQSRVSTHVAELEQRLGTQLVDRTVTPVGLTPEGRALLPQAQEVLARLGLLGDLAASDGHAVGCVRIGMYPSVAAYLYAPLVRRLGHDQPRVDLQVLEGPTLSLEDRLSAGEIDLAVRPVLPLVRDNRLVHAILWREPLVAVVPYGHALADRPRTRLADVARHDLITIGDAGLSRRQFEPDFALATAGLRPRIARQSSQPQTLVSLVRHGLGVGLTNALAMLSADITGVTLVPVTDADCERVVALFSRWDQPDSPAVDAVREAVHRIDPPTWPWSPWSPPAPAGPAVHDRPAE